MKLCTRCRQTKPLDQFYNADRYHCKKCERELARWRMQRFDNKIRTAWRDAKKQAKKHGVEDTLTLDEVAYIFALSGGRCAYTGKFAVKPTLEHIIPMSRGGANAAWNVIVVDYAQNISKNDTDPSDWLQFKHGYRVEKDLIALMAARKGVTVEAMQSELFEFQRKYSDEWYRKHVTKKVVASG